MDSEALSTAARGQSANVNPLQPPPVPTLGCEENEDGNWVTLPGRLDRRKQPEKRFHLWFPLKRASATMHPLNAMLTDLASDSRPLGWQGLKGEIEEQCSRIGGRAE